MFCLSCQPNCPGLTAFTFCTGSPWHVPARQAGGGAHLSDCFFCLRETRAAPHLQVFVSSNQSVQEGDPLVVVEAMKMEHTGEHTFSVAKFKRLLTDFSTDVKQGSTGVGSSDHMLPGCIRASEPAPSLSHQPCHSSLSALPAVRAPCAGTVAELHSFVDAQVGLLGGGYLLCWLLHLTTLQQSSGTASWTRMSVICPRTASCCMHTPALLCCLVRRRCRLLSLLVPFS